MGILRLIASILKAVPVLGRLFLRLADEQKEKKAQTRYEEKLDFIDDAVDRHHRPGVRNGDSAEQCKATDGSPPVPKRRKSRTSVDKGGTKKSSRTGVRTRKKVGTPKKKKGGKKKSVQKPKG